MNKTNGKRDVDELVQENKSSWKKDFVYIKKGKVRSWKVLISLVFLLGASAAIFLAVYYKVQTKSMASTGTATLTWNANAETDLGGYKIYYGETKRTGDCPLGGYAAIIDAGKVTSHTIDNLTEGKTYYFSITAYNTAGAESCFSGETSKYIPVSLVRDNTCTDFTYLDWEACQSDGTQARTVLSSSPDGCSGGTSVTSQNCTYEADLITATTCTSFKYSKWSACSNGTRTRTVSYGVPSGCTGGSPILSESCRKK